MKKVIFYGVNGEGLGHSCRAMSVIEELHDCEVHVFAYGNAFDFFQRQHHPHLHRIKGVRFSYKNGRVNHIKTVANGLSFALHELGLNIDLVSQMATLHDPQLFITDLEPSIPRVAQDCEKPLISIDNQHRFAYHDMAELPLWLRAYGWLCGAVAKCIVPRPTHTVISTFHHDLIDPKGPRVTIANGLLRRELLSLEPSKGDFLLVYTRESVCPRFLRYLDECKFPIKIYGAGEQGKYSSYCKKRNFQFKDQSCREFVHDLAHCRALMGTAGNQLITEARYFGKPFLMFPEPRQYEQSINAIYAEKLGIGNQYNINEIGSDMIKDWYFNSNSFNRYPVNGLEKVINVIRSYLK